MKLFTIAFYEFIKNTRNIKLLIALILFPIIMIFILGNAIDGFFTPEDGQKVLVGYINEDNGPIGNEFDTFINQKEILKILELKKLTDMAEGKKALQQGEVDVLIHLDKETSSAIYKGERQTIHLYGKKNVELIESVVKYYSSSFNTVNALIMSKGMPLNDMQKEETLERVTLNSKGSIPKAIDYYSVLSMLQILLGGAIFGVFITTRKYESDLHIRIGSLPLSQSTITIGRIIGSILYVLTCSVVTVLFSKFVFNANWNGNIFIIAGALLIFSTISVGMGLVIGRLTPDLSTAIGVIFMIIMLFATISGSISPVSSVESLNFIVPNYHAKTLIFGTIYGYSNEIMINSAISLLLFSFITYIVAAILGRRRKYDNI